MGNNGTAARESPRTDGVLYSHSSVDMNLKAETGFHTVHTRLKPRPAHKFELWSAKVNVVTQP